MPTPEVPLVLAQTPVQDVPEAIALMTAIDEALADNDGLKWFNRMYLAVTKEVRVRLEAMNGWNDPAWLAQVDVIFANLYFDALRLQGAAPRSWRVLLERRVMTDIARLQFALAGMNAHINRDLAAALPISHRLAGGGSQAIAARYEDFTRVNTILEEVEKHVKADLAIGIVADIDIAAGDLDDVLAMWSVRAAREAAWLNGTILGQLDQAPWLASAFIQQLDRTVAFAGRGLVLPLGI